MATDAPSDQPAPARPRLNLKPRDPVAAAQLELQRSASLGKQPFGDAKPREAIIASRVGKTEEEVLKEEVRQERLKLRLNPQQLEEQRAAEAAIDEIKDLIKAEGDGGGGDQLKAELAARETALEDLMDGFAKLALEAAARGEVQRPSERRREQLAAAGGAAGGDAFYGGASAGAGAARGGYGERRGGFQSYEGRGGGGRYGDSRRGGYQDAGGRREYQEGPRDGPRGFSNYQERAAGAGGDGYDSQGRGGGGGYRGGGGGSYRGGRGGEGGGYREYYGPSDRDNAETFGVAATAPRYNNRGGGSGRREYGDGGYKEASGSGGGGYREPSGGFDDDPRNYPGMGGDLRGNGGGFGGGPYDREGGGGAGFVQDRY